MQVEVTELDHYLLGPEDADICIKSFGEGARAEGGCRKFVLLDTEGGSRGAEVAEIRVEGGDTRHSPSNSVDKPHGAKNGGSK